MQDNTELPDAGEFMGEIIERFAALHPQYTKDPMRGQFFWVVTCYFPEILAELQLGLTRLARQLYLAEDTDSSYIAWVRTLLVKLTTRGDLGENHTEVYLNDHGWIDGLSSAQAERSPFAPFCRGMLELAYDPIVLLGALTRNEEGSVAEAQAMVEQGLIVNGKFAQLHLEEEPEHAAISAEIRLRMLAKPKYAERFREGMRRHDELYSTILE